MDDKRVSVMTLKVIAAKAAKLAYDLEHNRLYSRDLYYGVSDIKLALSVIEDYVRSIEA